MYGIFLQFKISGFFLENFHLNSGDSVDNTPCRVKEKLWRAPWAQRKGQCLAPKHFLVGIQKYQYSGGPC